jgi:hypothetical protein
MNSIRETTVWTGTVQPNHTYLMDGNRAVAYIKQGSKKPFYFSKPWQMNLRGRTFKPVVPNPFKVKQSDDVIEVAGSNGAKYFVNTAEKTCTCPGFTFRGACKHTKDLK